MPYPVFTGLLSLFAFVPLSLSFYLPNQSPLSFDDQVRERHLYTGVVEMLPEVTDCCVCITHEAASTGANNPFAFQENKRQGLFLEISHDGRVRGTPVQTVNSILELKSIRPGETVIKGVSSSLYLCVDSSGHLRGQRQYIATDCTFRELLQPDGYTVFQSPHNGLRVSLSPKQPGLTYARPFSQFLPLMNELMILGMERAKNKKEKPSERWENVDLGSDDPLGMRMSVADGWSSPAFLSR